MIYKFKNALIRKPSVSITNAISSNNIKPNYQKICNEHNKYMLKSLISLKINVHTLDALEDFPDSIFIEDPALAYNNHCILLRPATAI